MKSNETFGIFGDISDKYITAADLPAVKKHSGKAKKYIGIAACFVLAAGTALAVYRFAVPHGVNKGSQTVAPDGSVSSDVPVKTPQTQSERDESPTASAAADQNITVDESTQTGFTDHCLASPVQAKFPAYPDERILSSDSAAWDNAYKTWNDAKREIANAPAPYKSSLNGFTEKTVKEFVLKNADKNCVYSPVNVYLALSMCAELANGETQSQINSLLGADGIEAVRENASALFKKTCFDDGAYVCVPANSVWLNEQISYKPDTMKTLADIYKAYSFSGKPGTAEYDDALHAWLNYATGNLLEDSVNGLQMSPDTVMTLVSSLYLSAAWQNEFRTTEKGVFRSPGGDLERDFMLNGEQTEYYYAEDFSAVQVPIESGGTMWVILPDADKSTADVLSGSDFYSFIKDPSGWSQKKWCYVKMKLPKFDVTSDADLKDGLMNLGLTDIFAPERSDFSNLSDITGVFVDKVQHSARVKTDEKGITAAAFTAMQLCGSAMPNDEVDFIVDRPFVFAVTGTDGSVLFCGTVNEP